MLYQSNMDEADSLVYTILLYNWSSLEDRRKTLISDLCVIYQQIIAES